MYSGATIFSQLMQQLPWRRFQTIVDHIIPLPGAYYVMGRAYLDFERL